MTNNITLNGTTTINGLTGALVGDNLGGLATNTLSGTLTLAGGVFSNVSTSYSDKTISLQGQVTGSGGLQVDLYRGLLPPNVILANSTNNYVLGTLVNSGALKIAANSITSGSGAATTITSGPTGTGLVTLATGSWLDLGASSLAVAGLSGGGTVGSTSTTGPGALTIVTGATARTFTGVINNIGPINGVSGNQTVSLIIAGSGVQTLGGVNTYTGGTTLSGGTLNLTGTLGGGAGGGTAITSSATFSESSTGLIAGTSTLSVTVGTTTLAGANTYTGATSINAGTLRLSGSGSLANSPSITLSNGATFDVSTRTSGSLGLSGSQTIAGAGTVSGGLLLPSGATLSPGVSAGTTNVGTLTTGNLTIAAGTTMNTYFGTPGTFASPGLAGLVQVNGNLALPASGLNINLLDNNNANANGAIGAGVYDIMNFTGALTGFTPGANAAGTFSITSTPLTGRTYTFSQSGNSILLSISSNVAALTWTGAAGSGGGAAWDTASSNWANGSTPATYADPNSATFNDASALAGNPAITNSNITIQAGGVSPAFVTFNNANVNYTLNNSGADTVGITGATGITKNGTGTLNLQSPNTFTGPIALNAGAINVSNGTALGTPSFLAGVTVANGAALQLSGGISTVGGIPATINGAGLTAAPAGAITNLSGANTFAGPITLASSSTVTASAGTLNLTGGIATAGYGLTINGPGAVNVSTGSISGTGSLTYSGSGTLSLSDAHAYSGGTTIASGVVAIGSDAALGAASTNVTFSGNATLRTTADTNQVHGVIVNNGVTATIDTNSHNATFSSISGSSSAGIVKTGAGTLILNGANSYAGATRVVGGVLKLSLPAPIMPIVQVDATKSTGLSITAAANYGSQGGVFSGAAGVVANGVNGHQAFSFNGTSQVLSSINAYTNTGAAVTEFFVETQASQLNSYTELSFIGPNGNVDWNTSGNMLVEGATTIHPYVGANAGDITRPAVNTPLIWDAAINTAAGQQSSTSNLIVNAAGSASVSSGSGPPHAVPLNINTVAIGGRYDTGTTMPRPNFVGDIGEVLIYNTVLTAAQRASVEAYLEAKWLGIGTGTGNLPTAAALQLGSGATLDLNGLNQQVASLSDVSGAGGTITSSTAGSIALTLAPTTATTFSGAIQDGSGTLRTVVGGSSTQTLAGASTYSGGTTMNSGTLRVSNGVTTSPSNSATGSGTLTLNGGTLAAGASGGSIAGSVVAGSGPHTIAPSSGLSSGTFATLNFNGGLTTSSNTTLAFNFGTTPNGTGFNGLNIYVGDLLNFGGPGLTVGAGTPMTFGGVPLASGDYRLFGGSFGTPTLANFTLPPPTGSSTYSLATSVDTGFIDLVVVNNTSLLTLPATTLNLNMHVSGSGTPFSTTIANGNSTSAGRFTATTSGTNGLNFNLTGSTNVPAGGATTLNVGWSDTSSAGARNGQITIVNNGNAGDSSAPKTQAVSGGVYNLAATGFSGATLSFGDYHAGAAPPAAQSISIGNTAQSGLHRKARRHFWRPEQ